MKNLNLKTIAGVGVGVAVAHYGLKSSNVLVLLACGVGGGILAHTLLNNNTKSGKTAMSNGVAGGEATSSMDGDDIRFNPRLGYMMPTGKVKETDGADYMDVSF
jgi:hypothetical protein